MSLTQRTSLLEPADATPSTRGRGLHRSVTMSELNDGGAQKAAMLAILTYFVVGVAYYGYLATPEKFALVDALYFVVVTVTTVGYGDLNEEYKVINNSLDKVFTSFFVLTGVGLIGAAIGVIVAAVLDREDALAKQLAHEPGSSRRARRFWHLTEAQAKVAFSFLQMSIVLLWGTVCFALLEGQSIVTSFYWCSVTVTTVGYGDVAPTTDAGKYFAIFFIMVGTVLMAKSLSDIAGLPLEARRVRNEEKVLRQYGTRLDVDEFREILLYVNSVGLSTSHTSCTKTEFVLSMLLKLEKVDRDDISRCAEVFNSLDVHADGRLDAGDLRLPDDVGNRLRRGNTVV